MKDSGFQEFFLDESKDIYWAESHLVKAIPKMEKAATSDEFKVAFKKHAAETKGHMKTLE